MLLVCVWEGALLQGTHDQQVPQVGGSPGLTAAAMQLALGCATAVLCLIAAATQMADSCGSPSSPLTHCSSSGLLTVGSAPRSTDLYCIAFVNQYTHLLWRSPSLAHTAASTTPFQVVLSDTECTHMCVCIHVCIVARIVWPSNPQQQCCRALQPVQHSSFCACLVSTTATPAQPTTLSSLNNTLLLYKHMQYAPIPCSHQPRQTTKAAVSPKQQPAFKPLRGSTTQADAPFEP